MVYTRSKLNMEAMENVIDQKLKELKVSLLTEFKAVLDEYFEGKKEEFKSFIEWKNVELQVPKELSESVRVIQQHVNTLKAENIMLKKSVENLQQYVRRPNIRIFGVPVFPNESSEEVNKFVLGMITNNNIDIPLSSIDRAHRIGKVVESRNHPNQKVQPIIVRFTSFRDRTVFYRARKSVVLTTERYSLLNEARKQFENIQCVQFVYSDINCNLRAFTANRKHLLFDSIADLQCIISGA